MQVRDCGTRLLGRLLEHVVATVPGVAGAGAAVRAPARPPPRGRGDPGDDVLRVVVATGVAAELDQLQLDHGGGPLVDALLTGRAVVVGQAGGGPDLGAWPDLAEVLLPAAGQVVALGCWPGEPDTERTVVLTVYLRGALSGEGAAGPERLAVLERLAGLVGHAVALVERCEGEERRAEQMVMMNQYRRVVEQAKGAVMVAVGTDGPGAFSILSRASQHFNVRLRNLAVALVEHVGGGVAEHPDDPEAVITCSPEERRAAQQVWAALTSGP